MQRELVVLGTAAQVPTRHRNHNACLLRWDDEVILFDPGEGTQRQLILTGESPAKVTRICITHFHGDHCLGLPGVIQRLSLDRVPHPVHVHYPASGRRYFDRLRAAAIFHERADVRGHPCEAGVVVDTARLRIEAGALDHRVDTLGWRVSEPEGRTMLPDRLRAAGIEGPDVGMLQALGSLDLGGRTVTLAEVSAPRPGQSFAFLMDTAFCDTAVRLASGADLVVCEATFLSEHADEARRFKHLTAGQAGLVAARAGARSLVLTHFSQRYEVGSPRFAEEAARAFDGDIVVAHDLLRVPLPPRRRPKDPGEVLAE